MRRKRQKTSGSASGAGTGAETHLAQLLFPGDFGGNMLNWKVKEGQQFEAQDVLARCACNLKGSDKTPILDLLAPYDGTLLSIERKEGESVPDPTSADAVPEQQTVARISYCKHEVILAGFGLCGVCGRAPSQLSGAAAATAKLTHSGPNGLPSQSGGGSTSSVALNVGGGEKIIVSRNEAEIDRKDTVARLFRQKKLLLVLDIDHTMLHATDDDRAPAMAAAKGLSHCLHSFKLPSSAYYHTPDKLHYVMLRPGLIAWLEDLATMYELYIYTAGTRIYAEAVAAVFDPDQRLFGSRIITRTDVPELGKVKRLERFFPVDNSMVLAVDDRSDVWTEDASNLVTIRPYHFFHGMADINNTSGPEFDLKGETELEDKEAKEPTKIDHGLRRVGELLRWVHQKFYAANPSVANQVAGRGSDVKPLLRELRKRILRGMPLAIDASPRSPEWDALCSLAAACGGACADHITPQTVAVIASRPSSAMALDGKNKRIWVVHPDWLHACIHNWNKEPFPKYSIFGVAKRERPDQPPAASASSASPQKAEAAQSSRVVEYDEFGYEIEVTSPVDGDDLAPTAPVAPEPHQKQEPTELPKASESTSPTPSSTEHHSMDRTTPSTAVESGSVSEPMQDGSGPDNGKDSEDDEDDDEEDVAGFLQSLK